MEQVYSLFDRRCRSDTALEKLARLRRRVRRFKKVGKTLQRLFSPNLQKALIFLDDKLLPATSNAVERGNRRHRKMQKSVYPVRARAEAFTIASPWIYCEKRGLRTELKQPPPCMPPERTAGEVCNRATVSKKAAFWHRRTERGSNGIKYVTPRRIIYYNASASSGLLS